MSDPKDQQAKPADPPPASSSIMPSIGAGTIVSALLGVLGAAAGAGWPGVIALGTVGFGIALGFNFLMGVINQKADERDLKAAGDDAGKTSVDLANQGRAVSKGLDTAQGMDPPTAGFPDPK